MRKAKVGDTVSIHYTGRHLDGKIFDTTSGEEPLAFTLGQNDLIDGLDEAVLGMAVGEKKSVKIEPEKAHGQKSEDSLIEMDRADLPEDYEVQVGDELELTGGDGIPFLVVVSAIEADTVILDRASPLAGETLVFDLELVAIA